MAAIRKHRELLWWLGLMLAMLQPWVMGAYNTPSDTPDPYTPADGTWNLSGKLKVAGDNAPSSHSTYDLGESTSNRWRYTHSQYVQTGNGVGSGTAPDTSGYTVRIRSDSSIAGAGSSSGQIGVNGNSDFIFANSAGRASIYAERIHGTSYFEVAEIAAPGTASADTVRLYVDSTSNDLMAVFDSGAAVTVASHP